VARTIAAGAGQTPSGYGRAGVAARFEATVVLQKPFEESQLRRALLQSVAKT
jgi:hypothetical protein